MASIDFLSIIRRRVVVRHGQAIGAGYYKVERLRYLEVSALRFAIDDPLTYSGLLEERRGELVGSVR